MDRLEKMQCSGLSFCTLLVFILTLLWAPTTHGQSVESAGYPWTYVPRVDVPTDIIDTVHERSLDTMSWLCPDSEIRQVFYVYVHPELMLGDSLGRFPVIVPREPGVADTITMQNFFLDSNRRAEYLFIGMGGLFSSDRPEYFSGDVELTCFYRTIGDTSCRGYIARLPATYHFVNNNSKFPTTRWLNIVQCVDSIWHPPLTTSSQEVLLGHMESMKVYPNPVQRGARVHIKLIDGWPSGPSKLVLTGPGGQVLYRRLLAGSPDEGGYALPQNLPVGLYTLVAISDERKAAARLVVQ